MFIKELKSQFEAHADALVAAEQAKYMKDLFPFLGLKKPERVRLQRPLLKKYAPKSEEELISVAGELWEMEAREYQYVACELIEKSLPLCTEKSLSFFEALIRKKSWWDTVDKIASSFVGALVKKYPPLKGKVEVWSEDSFLWIRRSALLFQLKYKKDTDEQMLFALCKRLMEEKDFFIRKAIGWALREYSKTAPEEVKSFILTHQKALSPLSFREGMKVIDNAVLP